MPSYFFLQKKVILNTSHNAELLENIYTLYLIFCKIYFIYVYVNTYKYIYEYMYVYIWEYTNPCKLTFAWWVFFFFFLGFRFVYV